MYVHIRIEFRRQKLEVAFVPTVLVYLLTMASQTGRGFMNGEVAGSILTVFPKKRRKKEHLMFQEPVKLR